jgi:hypothetical protein
MYYMQDTRSTADGKPLWWRKGCAGYTTKLNEAEIFTHDEVFAPNHWRDTDIPVPVEVAHQHAAESVGLTHMGWVILDKNGDIFSMQGKTKQFFGATLENDRPDSEYLEKLFRDWAGLGPFTVRELYV